MEGYKLLPPKTKKSRQVIDIPQIMDRLGHTDDQTTKNIYLHVTTTMKKEASQKSAQLMETFF